VIDPQRERLLLDRVKRLLVEALRMDGLAPEGIGDDQHLFGEGLGLDSVDALEVVVALEREFGIAIPSEEVGGEVFRTPRSLAHWLAPRVPSSAGAAR
jgi:acyl carrier protein